MIRLAKQYGRYGYRKIAELLRIEGWHVNHKKVERLWRAAWPIAATAKIMVSQRGVKASRWHTMQQRDDCQGSGRGRSRFRSSYSFSRFGKLGHRIGRLAAPFYLPDPLA